MITTNAISRCNYLTCLCIFIPRHLIEFCDENVTREFSMSTIFLQKVLYCLCHKKHSKASIICYLSWLHEDLRFYMSKPTKPMIFMLHYERTTITQPSFEKEISIVGDQQVWHKINKNFQHKEPHVTCWNLSKILYVISKN